MFAHRITKIVEVQDGEDTVLVHIRKLSAVELREANEAKQAEIATLAKNMGPALMGEFQRAAKEKDEKAPAAYPRPVPTPKTPEELKVAREAQFYGYERMTTLKRGIVRWGVKETVEEGIPLLDEETCELLFREIMELSIPPADAFPKG